jgi:iron complex outermembrane receptor protein
MHRLVLLSAIALATAAACAAVPQSLSAQGPGVVAGRVLAASGDAAADAQVTLIELRRRTVADPEGRFRLENVPPGQYLLEVLSERFGNAVRSVTVQPGESVEVEVTLDRAVHFEEVVVTVGPEGRGLGETYEPVATLSGSDLATRRQPTLGETLAAEPGVSATSFGAGASRPIIRGLGGDRIRVLESGIGTGDASSTSPDHAVSTDPLSAESIEIVRGPATLLYGGSAVGGVVNVLDRRIPAYVPDAAVTGSLDLRGGTVADERTGGLSLDGGLGSRVAWHGEYVRRNTHDYEIPGFAESERLREQEEEEGGEHEDEEHEEAFGVLPNSALESEAGAVGLSYVGDGGFVGASYSGFDTFYGIPGGHHHEEEPAGAEGEGEEEEEAPVRIDLQQRRVDVRGEVNRAFGVLRGLRARLGVTDYEHVELEGTEVGTRFTNDYWEGRIDAPHGAVGPLSGSVGLQVSSRDFAAVGEEAFLPPSETDAWALFAFEELTAEPWSIRAGARFESQSVATDELERSPEGLSVSLGTVWWVHPAWAVSLSLTRAVKLPNAEELFSNGPHIATNAFEIGDPDLGSETSTGADLSLRRIEGPLAGELTLFATRFDDYIFESQTGEEEDGLRVLRYVQRNASFVGGELHADVELVHAEPHHLVLELVADAVRAELVDEDEPLPRIPPVRFGGGLRYQGDRWRASTEVRRTTEQDRVAPFEEPTEGYTMWNAAVAWRVFAGATVHELELRGTNLADEEARNHTSFLKDVVPLPGRDISLSYRVTF